MKSAGQFVVGVLGFNVRSTIKEIIPECAGVNMAQLGQLRVM